MKDFYAILGTSTNSNSDELKSAYEKLADKFNPELNAHDHFFTDRYIEIREAYEVLSDPLKRQRYDATFVNSKYASASERRKIKQYYSSTKGVNSALTIILIALTLIFGYFVFKAISSHKAPSLSKPLAVNETPVHTTTRRHKKKKRTARWKALPVASTVNKAKPAVEIKKDTVKPHPVQVAAALAQPVTAQNISVAPIAPKPVKQQSPKVTETFNRPPAVIANQTNKPDYLYTTYVKGNETGVVKLRETASYNAATIKTIPNNSQVAVLERGNLYYKVMFENVVGYVPKWTVLEK